MELYLTNISTWYPHKENTSIKNVLYSLSEHPVKWPDLKFVPVMQKRRLTPLAKMTLHVAEEASQNDHDVAIVFSSRHGDLHQTSKLLQELAKDNLLSPTAFGLSVHNAAPSLFSILNNNKQPINAIAAGKDSFFMVLIDAYARLKSGVCNKILVIYSEQDLPDVYSEFADEALLPHSLAMMVTLKPNENTVNQAIKCSFSASSLAPIKNETLPASIMFIDWLSTKANELCLYSSHYSWVFYKNA